MDHIDRRMLSALEQNPRLTFRSLSKMLGISIASVQYRLSALEKSGCILGYHTWLSLELLGGLRAVVHGKMKGVLDREILTAIEANGSIIVALMGSQSHLYLWVNLLNISDLEGVLRTAQTNCRIEVPEVLIIGPGSRMIISSFPDRKDRPTIETLKEIDYMIICSLHHDARKPISKLAYELGHSTKMVRRHLSRLIENDLIEFFISQDSQQREELFFIVFITLKSMVDREEVVERLKKDRSSFISHILTFCNQPNLLAVELITRSVAEFRDKFAELQGYEEVESITWDLCQQRHYFRIWRDKMLEEMFLDCKRGLRPGIFA